MLIVRSSILYLPRYPIPSKAMPAFTLLRTFMLSLWLSCKNHGRGNDTCPALTLLRTLMLAFWLLEISTVVFIVFSLEYFLSGHVFPLDLLPAWLAGFVKWGPFAYELYFPIQVFMERIRGEALTTGLAIQAGWAAIAWPD